MICVSHLETTIVQIHLWYGFYKYDLGHFCSSSESDCDIRHRMQWMPFIYFLRWQITNFRTKIYRFQYVKKNGTATATSDNNANDCTIASDQWQRMRGKRTGQQGCDFVVSQNNSNNKAKRITSASRITSFTWTCQLFGKPFFPSIASFKWLNKSSTVSKNQGKTQVGPKIFEHRHIKRIIQRGHSERMNGMEI